MYWKKKTKPPEFTLKDVTIAKALPFLSVTITPDVYLITGTGAQTIVHKIDNKSPFAVVVKVLATAPARFTISKNNFFIEGNSSSSIQIKLKTGAVRSHRLDLLFLPCIDTLNPNWKANPCIAFNSSYKPIIRHI
ncbi:unnamed protein product, partial [Cylicocyclus nassatus]